MKGTGAKRNVCRGSCVSTGATFPVAPVESAPMCTSSYIMRNITQNIYHYRIYISCRLIESAHR